MVDLSSIIADKKMKEGELEGSLFVASSTWKASGFMRN